MLDISFEFVKGVLFVRLEGTINNNNSKNIETNLINIISNGGIRFLVFNISNLIIEEDVSLFNKCNNIIKENKGKMYICGLSDITKIITSNIKTCKQLSSEINVFRELGLC